MEKSRLLFGVLTAIVVILAVVVHYQYLTVQKEKSRLEKNLEVLAEEKNNLTLDLEKSKIDLNLKLSELSRVSQEKESLSNELGQAQLKLSQNEEALAKIKLDLANYEKEKKELALEFDSLKKNYDSLKAQFDTVSQAKTTLEQNLHSLPYLKQAVKQAKKEAHLAKTKPGPRASFTAPFPGKYENQGFIIKDGKPTYMPQVKVEVLPAE